MSRWETAQITAAYQDHCQDRVAVFTDEERAVLVVADGAGGSGAGERASAQVVQEVARRWKGMSGADAWAQFLAEIDLQISDGETTAVIVEMGADICGASVGDSQAWLIAEGVLVNLTCEQNRKPLLGSGRAIPVAFRADLFRGVVLLATDGFCNYVKRDGLFATVAQTWFPVLPKELLEVVRLPSGELWDDVGIVVCRERAQSRPRVKHYVID